MGGLAAIVFTAGMGEHSAPVRCMVCDGLGFLGVELDAGRYVAGGGERIISAAGARTAVLVVPTDEERMIAIDTLRLARAEGIR